MSEPRAILSLLQGGVFVEERAIGGVALSIGRSQDNDLILADPTVSRQHARIDLIDDQHILVDLSGRGATLVNGDAVERHALKDGDEIVIGAATISYSRESDEGLERTATVPGQTLIVYSPTGQVSIESWKHRSAHGELNPTERELWTAVKRFASLEKTDDASVQILEELRTHVPFDRGQIVYATESDAVSIAASFPKGGRSAKPLSDSVIRQVLATGQALACMDVGQDRRFRASESLAGTGARSVLAAPLIVAGHVAGGVCVVRDGTAEPFDGRDLESFCTFIQLAAEVVRDLQRIAKVQDKSADQRRRADLPYPLVYCSDLMQRVTEQVLRVASTEATVLIAGPSGSGKELIASSIHYSSMRSGGPFVKVNCAAIPENLIESELFGHEAGAFTDARSMRKGRFEIAHNGTLFLDEIGDMPPAVQTKLLRAIEAREIERVGGQTPIPVNVRLIAATHRDLPQMVRDGKFREDLWYRLDVVRIDVPPLRARAEDVPLLFKVFAESFADSMQTEPVRVTVDAEKQLMQYDWPGNVRQLRNFAERLTVFHPGEALSAEGAMKLLVDASREAALGDAQPSPSTTPPGFPLPEENGSVPLRPLAEARADFEREYVRRALLATEGNITKAAELLGLARENLSRKIKQLQIDVPS